MINGQIDNNTITIYTLKEFNFDFGLNTYPIFDEAYRPILNKAILDFYLFTEIGFINPMQFKHFLNTRMDLLMRNKYNALYKAKAIEFNPLYNVEMKETFTRTVEQENNVENNSEITATNTSASKDVGNSTSESTSQNDAKALSLMSTYPSENMTNGDWEDNVYVNNGQRQTNNTENTENSEDNTVNENTSSSNGLNKGKITIGNNGNETETYTRFTEGSSAGLPFSRAMIQLKQYLDEFQLDQQIIAELSDLFYNLY